MLTPVTGAEQSLTRGGAILQDPLIYRLYEVVGVDGQTLKDVVQKKFIDSIMSVIDFSMDVEREEDPKGNRVKIAMNGKFLPDWTGSSSRASAASNRSTRS
ncbi:hypothetical protein B9H00_05370 [Kushneria marisflavi]|uniref:Cyanate lyase C-terminal domain-containing protein n=1 Tax=Kushneria marisflavi TaxID=157779 RepID=A0A240UM31_9GAMM|nr:hypothetical protein B9H00_05370 [Kushneria marisflavi]